MKQRLLLLLAAFATLLPLHLVARDFTYTYEGQTITYTVIDEDAKTCSTKNGEYLVGAGNNVTGNLILSANPKENGVEYTLTTIGDFAFYNCNGLTSVTIPTSVITIGSNAFEGCSGLTSMTIPNSVTTIGKDAFSDCNHLLSVSIPNSVTTIGGCAFFDCTSLTSVTIPNSVLVIGERAFYGCSGLNSVTIPNSVTTIGENAFCGCSGLTSLTISNKVTSIEMGAFSDCTSLTSVAIPNSVTEIGDKAFFRCGSLTSVSIPNSVTEIGNNAFSGCSSLTSVSIPNSVTEIGNNAFSECSGLTSVTIPNSIISLSFQAFDGCSSLTSVTIPNSVTTIGYQTFSRSGLTSVTIPNSVTAIGSEAFRECSCLTSVTIPNSVTEIGEKAFFRCSSLTSVTIPNSVTQIGYGAFQDCNNLKLALIFTETLGEGISNENTVLAVPESMIDAYKDKYPNNIVKKNSEYPVNNFTTNSNSFEIRPNSTAKLQLSLANADLVNGIQFDITLPSGLSIADNSGKPDVTLGAGAASSHTLTSSKVSGDNRYRVVVYSSINEPFTSGENLLSINISADNDLQGGEITISNCTFTLDNDISISPEDYTITVPASVKVTQITVNPSEVTINKGGTSKLTATIEPSTAWNQGVTWSSSDASIAVVSSDGTVTAKAKGAVTITATASDGSGIKGSASITVTNYAQSISLEESVTIEENQTLQLTPKVTPSDVVDLNIEWTSENADIAYVAAGDMLHAVKPGSTIITATDKLSGKSACMNVTVTPAPIKVKSITVTSAKESVNMGSTLQLTATVSPDNVDVKTVAWSSSNESVAIVSNGGVVTPKAKGTVTITATATDGSGVKGSVTIAVTNYAQGLSLGDNITIEEDETLVVVPQFTPADSDNRLLSWTSTDASVAYVDASNTLHALVPGTATITATNEASGISASVNVTVTTVLYGDANDDNSVNIGDVVTEVQYILEKNPQPFHLKKADVSRDKKVDIVDVTKTIGIILAQPASQSYSMPMRSDNVIPKPALIANDVEFNSEHSATLTLNVEDADHISALQGDIILPEGVTVTGISLPENQGVDHIVDYVTYDDNRVRFVVYSLGLMCFSKNQVMLSVNLNCDLVADSSLELKNVMAADENANMQDYRDTTVYLIVTGVDGIESDAEQENFDIISVQGMVIKRNASKEDINSLAPGIYIIGGKKILVR